MFKDVISTSKLLYFIKPPGWKHDGTGKVSDDLRKEWLMTKENKKNEF